MESELKIYCRLCAELKEVGKLIDLQEIVSNLMRLNQPFFALQDTSLPQKVCIVCVQSLEVCIQFINNLERAQCTLLNIFPNNYVDDDPDEPGDCFTNEEWAPFNLQILVKEEKVKEKKTKKKKSKSHKISTKTKSPKKSPKKSKSRFETSSDDDEPLYVESSALEKVKSWQDMQWTCSFCDLKLASRANLTEHSMNTHNNCTTYKCPSCDKKFLKLETYIFHIRKLHCTKLRMSCHICYQVFDTPRARVFHQKTHVPEPFACAGCSSSFQTKEQLDAHVISYYQDGRALRYYEKSEKLNLEPICNICNTKFPTRLKLKQHFTSSHRPKQPNICDQCGKTFANKTNLTNHMLVHYDIKDHKCSLCPASFRSASNLKDHMIRHKGEKNHSCPECGKSFLFRSQLKTHLTIHSGKFPFQCEFCEKSFRLNAQLKRHLRQHTGYKPYKCHVCEREFTDWPNYNKHMVRKHNIDTSKTKRTPHGVIRLAHLTGELAEAFAQTQSVANTQPEVKSELVEKIQ